MWEILKEMGIPDNITCLLGSLYAGQKATELDMEERTGSKLGKEYIRLSLSPARPSYDGPEADHKGRPQRLGTGTPRAVMPSALELQHTRGPPALSA